MNGKRDGIAKRERTRSSSSRFSAEQQNEQRRQDEQERQTTSQAPPQWQALCQRRNALARQSPGTPVSVPGNRRFESEREQSQRSPLAPFHFSDEAKVGTMPKGLA